MKKDEPKNGFTKVFEFGWAIYVFVISTICQILVFEGDKKLIAFSVLIGTCCGLAGGLAALLASPYGTDDKERLSKVSTTIATLITGYVVAKIFDPLIAEAFKNSERVFEIKHSVNLFVAIIAFISGFLATYQYRAYISDKISQPIVVTPQPPPTATVPPTEQKEVDNKNETEKASS